MLNLPIGCDMTAVESRLQRLAGNAIEQGDCLALRQLWCLLRNAEMKRPEGEERDELHRMREGISNSLAQLEAEALC